VKFYKAQPNAGSQGWLCEDYLWYFAAGRCWSASTAVACQANGATNSPLIAVWQLQIIEDEVL
jgi:hypothetical protein